VEKTTETGEAVGGWSAAEAWRLLPARGSFGRAQKFSVVLIAKAVFVPAWIKAEVFEHL
jgi:hypothetical protein